MRSSHLKLKPVIIQLNWYPDGRWRRRPEEGDAAAGDLRARDPDVHRTEEQQEAEGALRPEPPHQERHPASTYSR